MKISAGVEEIAIFGAASESFSRYCTVFVSNCLSSETCLSKVNVNQGADTNH